MSAKKPIAVLTSDLHFTPQTLELATSALKQAQDHAFRLKVPLIVAGDILDTKAVMRAECVNRLIELFDQPIVPTYVLVGNHDLVNEKSQEHSLNFLKPYVTVVEQLAWYGGEVFLIPYQSDVEVLRRHLKDLPKGSTVIMHQGVRGAYMGHYVQDKTSLPPEAFDGLRVVSGHYHRAQDIKCGETGLLSYIGSPYTQSFGEASDGPKGYRVLNNDGTLDLIPTTLREHIIHDMTVEEYKYTLETGVNGLVHCLEDLLWIKVRGTTSELAAVRKATFPHKLDLIPTDIPSASIDINKLTVSEVFDTIIDTSGETDEQRTNLKQLWRDLLEAP